MWWTGMEQPFGIVPTIAPSFLSFIRSTLYRRSIPFVPTHRHWLKYRSLVASVPSLSTRLGTCLLQTQHAPSPSGAEKWGLCPTLMEYIRPLALPNPTPDKL